MSAVHEKGLLHLSLTSANVLLSDPGSSMGSGHRYVAQLTDLGMGRIKRAALTNPARTREPTGTKHPLEASLVPWLAPEVVKGGDPQAASDVFSFYVLMYELVTGAKPHAGKSPAEVAKLTAGKKRLALPGDVELAKRWGQLVSPERWEESVSPERWGEVLVSETRFCTRAHEREGERERAQRRAACSCFPERSLRSQPLPPPVHCRNHWALTIFPRWSLRIR